MWSPSLPPLATSLWLAPSLAALAFGTGLLAAWLKRRFRLRTGDTRKIVHFTLFTTAAVLGSTWGLEAVNLLGGVTALYTLLVLALGSGHGIYEAVAREEDAPRRSLHVLLPFLSTALGGILSTSLFGSLAVVGFAVTGIADAIAEPVGIRWGRHRYPVPSIGKGVRSHRSLEGSAAVLAGAFAASLVVLWRMPGALEAPAGLARAGGVALAVAVVTTLTEAVTPHGLDNLTLQVAAAGTASVLA
jgi:phytol kinase